MLNTTITKSLAHNVTVDLEVSRNLLRFWCLVELLLLKPFIDVLRTLLWKLQLGKELFTINLWMLVLHSMLRSTLRWGFGKKLRNLPVILIWCVKWNVRQVRSQLVCNLSPLDFGRSLRSPTRSLLKAKRWQFWWILKIMVWIKTAMILQMMNLLPENPFHPGPRVLNCLHLYIYFLYTCFLNFVTFLFRSCISRVLCRYAATADYNEAIL